MGASDAAAPFAVWRRERRTVVVLLAVLAALVFVELPGSWLIEPDEARYAEVPREMLARGDVVTPELNGAHYFEKPPLLYWANAASIAVLGRTAFAARLPTRLAALAAALMLIIALDDALRLWGLWSAVILLSSPMGFVLARYNITDGVLTASLTLTFLALRRFLIEREGGAPATGALVALGAGAALAVLSKGLIGIVFPGLVLLLWVAITGQWRRVGEVLASPATLVFLALAVPWFVLVERASPGFARIFFVREHFERFATSQARRPGPIYYFVAAFVAGFLPWTIVFPRVLARMRDAWQLRRRGYNDLLFFALWFFVILVFFSFSHSKLLPYILPAFPAAAALTARVLLVPDRPAHAPLLVHAVLVTVLAAGGVGYGLMSGELARYHVTAAAVAGGTLLVAGAWTATARAAAGRTAFTSVVLGWCGLYLALIVALPSVSNDLSTHRLAVVASDVRDATVVSYRCYPQGFPWVLGHPIVVVDYVDELGSDGVRPPALYWSAADFWTRWNAGDRMVAVVDRRTLPEFGRQPRGATTLAENRKYVVVVNFPSATRSSAPR